MEVTVSTQTLNSATGYLISIGDTMKIWTQRKGSFKNASGAGTINFKPAIPTISGFTAVSYNFNAWKDGDTGCYLKYNQLSGSAIDAYIQVSAAGAIGFAVTVYYYKSN